jgi:CRP/FNR family transcriptional regulator, cyclic AMP receptor protein
MRTPYDLDITDNCRTCQMKHSGFFCEMTPQALKDFDAIKSSSAYPEGALLFLEKQDSRGVFMLCQGEVKLTISSSEGKTLILRIAKAGEILGLMAVLSGVGYEMTAETLHPCQIAYVRREDFLRFIAQHPEVYQGIIKQLSSNYHRACEQLRTVGLLASAPERLAKLLLEWSADGEETRQGKRITLPLTHEEIAECIGSCRETVTRTLSDFKNRNVVKLKGSSLFISNRAALESFVTG